MPDGETLRQLLGSAGFEQVEVEKRALPAVFPGGADQLSASLTASGVAGEVAALSQDGRAALDRRIVHSLASITVGDAVEATLHSHVATAVKPAG